MINMGENLKALPVVSVHLDIDYALLSSQSITKASEAIEFVSSKLFDSAKEKAVAIFLDVNLAPICLACVGQGTQANVTFSARDIVQTALLCNASYVTLVHNHPGANIGKKCCGPSREDILVTDTIVKACSTVGVQVYDSIIAAGEKKSILGEMKPVYYSIREHNYKYLKFKNGISNNDHLPLTEMDLVWKRDLNDRTNGESIADPASETSGIEYIVPEVERKEAVRCENEERLRASERMVAHSVKLSEFGFQNAVEKTVDR